MKTKRSHRPHFHDSREHLESIFGTEMEPKPTFRRDLFDHPVREVLRDQKMKKIEHVWSPGKVAFEDVVVSCSVLVSKRGRLDQHWKIMKFYELLQ